jgi:murein DD-endopeptidase MepM/ murein hydrolase activator NlpD
MPRLVEWLRQRDQHSDWLLAAGSRCGDAPFAMPTDGYIGFFWGDSFRPLHHHQGLDIFGGEEPGVTPVYAAYAGYLTRLADWKSTVIIRIPSDPLQSGRQIWTYYTHMADLQGSSFISDQFPPDTSEVYVEAGTLLGYQGNYSGTPGNPTGVHLHFSIVQDNGNGLYLNELVIKNTLDPSPYLGMALNAAHNNGFARCTQAKEVIVDR